MAPLDGVSVGNFSDIAAWSFCQDKILSTAGEGGMVTTSRSELWDVMWSFKDHGKTLKLFLNANIRLGFAGSMNALAPISASQNC